MHNNNPSDDHNVTLLIGLRESTDAEVIISYYNRSAILVPLISNKMTWDQVYNKYVSSIVEHLKHDKKDEALKEITNMLDSLESTVGA